MTIAMMASLAHQCTTQMYQIRANGHFEPRVLWLQDWNGYQSIALVRLYYTEDFSRRPNFFDFGRASIRIKCQLEQNLDLKIATHRADNFMLGLLNSLKTFAMWNTTKKSFDCWFFSVKLIFSNFQSTCTFALQDPRVALDFIAIIKACSVMNRLDLPLDVYREQSLCNIYRQNSKKWSS